MALSVQEHQLIEQIAQRDGVTFDEAATALVRAALARRIRRRTGKAPARVVPIVPRGRA